MQKKIARLDQETRPGHDTCDTTFLADRFKYRVPFETGRTQTAKGGRIEIREVWGTRSRIEIGGQYLVRGKYVLAARRTTRQALLLRVGRGSVGPDSVARSTIHAVDKQEGEFALVHGMAGPGHFHLTLRSAESYSRWFADVYFGTGDNVLREEQ